VPAIGKKDRGGLIKRRLIGSLPGVCHGEPPAQLRAHRFELFKAIPQPKIKTNDPVEE
jgi:hypothetical protein